MIAGQLAWTEFRARPMNRPAGSAEKRSTMSDAEKRNPDHILCMTDYLDRVFQATTIEEIWAMHIAKMADLGFDRLLYAFTRFKTANSLGSPEDSVILSNHPADYMTEFVQGGLYQSAPMVKWAADHEGAESWRIMAEKMRTSPLTPGERRFSSAHRRFHVTAGYTISFRDVSVRAKGGIGLCARDGLSQDDVDAIWADHGREITIANNVVHLRISALPYVSRRTLTARQREALEWVGDGKTTQDIATIMGLTAATVEKHLRLAREVLDVDTTAQAVLKASFRNQIFLVSDLRPH
jgi:DNA-binding CsgD family transcriptional regulator